MKKEWKNIEGKMVRFDVGSTTEQAQAESMPAGVICFTTDNKVVFNGEVFGDGDSFFDVNATDLPTTSGTATFPDDGGERRALYDKLAAACADGKTIRIYLGNGSSGKLYAVACYSEGRKATNRSCFILYFLEGKKLYYRFAQWNSTDATYTASASDFTIADASQVTELISRVATDEAAITTNAANIATNTAGIATNAANIATNATNIATNKANIATNAANIATNTTAIDAINTDKKKLWVILQGVDERDHDAIGELDKAVATNTTDIATNAAAIATNAAAIAANAKQIKEDYVEIEANTTRSIVNKNDIADLRTNQRVHAEAITNLTTRVEDDETTIATHTTNIATNTANIATLNTRVLELGNFATENEAMNALADLSICANQQISVAHLNYTADNTTYSITMLQCLSFDYCRQIIFNRDKMKQRGIKFTDCNRTAIKSIENQQFMFGDRLEWYARENKYVLNQYGSGAFNHSYCQPIPIATSSNDGLMSKELVQRLEALENKINAMT